MLVMAAGGIVVRSCPLPSIAVVQMRKFDSWVLPKGKLDDGETPLEAARREVIEETGHDVSVHEFLGTLAYDAGGRPKIVHFWRMRALGDGPVAELMDDVQAVQWLPLDQAVEILTHPREREFLRQVGPLALASSWNGSASELPRFESLPPSAPAGLRTPATGIPVPIIDRLRRWCRIFTG